MIKSLAERGQDKMKEVLINPNVEAPDIHYYMIRGGAEKTNITIWECGTIGEEKEYIKTYGHYHVGDISETYSIIQGEGILLLQKRKIGDDGQPVDDEIEIFEAKKVKTGDKIFIKPEMGHLLVNTGKIWLVTSDDSPVYPDDVDPIGLPGHADYKAIKKMRGFAYYVVEKNGVPTLVKNPKYKIVPEANINN
jgi:oxalate decarboxylase/phosphoglucose isomerase-like protein (cupin superfamily)